MVEKVTQPQEIITSIERAPIFENNRIVPEQIVNALSLLDGRKLFPQNLIGFHQITKPSAALLDNLLTNFLSPSIIENTKTTPRSMKYETTTAKALVFSEEKFLAIDTENQTYPFPISTIPDEMRGILDLQEIVENRIPPYLPQFEMKINGGVIYAINISMKYDHALVYLQGTTNPDTSLHAIIPGITGNVIRTLARIITSQRLAFILPRFIRRFRRLQFSHPR